jgi:transcriptional regulator with XRE-family HTH domain
MTSEELDFDLADRMRKALRVSGVSVQQMADYLGVTRGTVSTWINGHIHPSTQTLRLWAARCNVPYEWLTGCPESADTGAIQLAWAS